MYVRVCIYRLVTESLQEVEKEQEAMEAVLVRMTSTQSRESSPDTDQMVYEN